MSASNTPTPHLDAHEATSPAYLDASGMRAIWRELRRVVREEPGTAINRDRRHYAEWLYQRLGHGNMGRGDVFRALDAALEDARAALWEEYR